jgi:hypothetical protein
MIARPGSVVYWAACIFALGWAALLVTAESTNPDPNWTVTWAAALVGAAIIWFIRPGLQICCGWGVAPFKAIRRVITHEESQMSPADEAWFYRPKRGKLSFMSATAPPTPARFRSLGPPMFDSPTIAS